MKDSSKIIYPARQPLTGEIQVPGDKSISHRAVMLGAIAKGTTRIQNFLMGGDCLSTIDCFRRLGVQIDVNSAEGQVAVHGKGMHGLGVCPGAGNAQKLAGRTGICRKRCWIQATAAPPQD